MNRTPASRCVAALLGLLCLSLVRPAALFGADAVQAETAPGEHTPHLDPSFLDRTVSPCDDFYRFACGGWTASHPLPADEVIWGTFNVLLDHNRAILRTVLDEAARPDPHRDADQRKLGDFYASCMDEKAIDARGTAPLKPELDRIAALGDRSQLPALAARFQHLGAGVLFTFAAVQDFKHPNEVIAYTGQGGMALPDRDFYLKTDAQSVALRKHYAEHVRKMLQLSGEPADRAAAGAGAVLEIETGLARVALDRVSRRDPDKLYHKLGRAELQALTPGFSWEAYLAALRTPPVTSVNVTEPEFLKGLDRLLAETDLAKWRAYFRWHLLHAGADSLPKAFIDENFDFYGHTLAGAKQLQERWKRCIDSTDNNLGQLLGKAYVQKAFGPEAKQRTLTLIGEIEKALGDDIDGSDWMTAATKQQARIKLAAVTNKIGYPDVWRDYSALEIVRGDALGNLQRSAGFELQRSVAKIGKPVDRTEWELTPAIVNAGYNPLLNDITFPAGILQPPFFDVRMDEAVNYGAIGSVIGHELTHGFDDEGRRFAADGNLRDWWTPADTKSFEERASCLADEYSSFTVIDDIKLNGRLTLGENVADNGGLRLAYTALERALDGRSKAPIDGFTPEQRFFLGFAQAWCEVRSPQIQRVLATTDPHSPGRFRVAGVVSNMPEFAQAFHCPAGVPMSPAKRCRVW